jgi:hypothetical protein
MYLYRCNLDYEYDLYNFELTEGKRLNICSEFEYLMLYLPLDKGAFLHKKLPDDFLRNLPYRHEIHYRLKRDDKLTNFWGDLENIELERKLNSKVTSLKLENKYTINVSDKTICSDMKDVSRYRNRRKNASLLYQSPYFYSGIGQGKLLANTIIDEFPILCSQMLNRVIDIGQVITEKGELLRYINLVHGNGRYTGTVIVPEMQLATIISKFINWDLGEVLIELEKIKSTLMLVDQDVIKMGGAKRRQYDSFLFLDNGLQSYPLVELNYRKSMGQMFYEITKNNRHEYGIFWLTTKKHSLSKNIKKISPEGTKFSVYCSYPPDVTSLVELMHEVTNE